MTTANAQIPTTDTPVSGAVPSAPMVGNPRRTRGLDAAQLRRPAPTSAMVGNPRRTRRLNPAQFAAA